LPFLPCHESVDIFQREGLDFGFAVDGTGLILDILGRLVVEGQEGLGFVALAVQDAGERQLGGEWAVQGCLDWQRHGRLSPPQRVMDATEEYFGAEDALGRWLDERCVREPNAKSLTAELFNDWKLWAEASGEFVGAQRRFSDLLITRGLDKWRNGMGVRGFQGIGLKQIGRAHV